MPSHFRKLKFLEKVSICAFGGAWAYCVTHAVFSRLDSDPRSKVNRISFLKRRLNKLDPDLELYRNYKIAEVYKKEKERRQWYGKTLVGAIVGSLCTCPWKLDWNARVVDYLEEELRTVRQRR